MIPAAQELDLVAKTVPHLSWKEVRMVPAAQGLDLVAKTVPHLSWKEVRMISAARPGAAPHKLDVLWGL